MKFLFATGVVVMALAAQQNANAATLSYGDFELISVVPRSPNVKPQLMAIPAKESNQLPPKAVRPSEARR